MQHFTPPTVEELQALLPNYQVQQIISHQAHSAIYSAIHATLGRQVAIRILPHYLSENEAFSAAFQEIAQTLASLQHPNVAGVYDFGNVNGMLFNVMEHISGRSLADVVFGQVIAQELAVSLISSLCKGLSQAHRSGILHLDVKPSNVLLDNDGNAKIVNFRGVLPSADEVGPYTSPEITSLPSNVDQRADVYALGVMLYELLTAQMPAEHIVPASSLVQTDPRLDAIIIKALHPNYEMRYVSCDEMEAELAQLIAAPLPPHMAGAARLATPTVATAPVALGGAKPAFTTGNTALVAATQQSPAVGVASPQISGALAGIAGRPTTSQAGAGMQPLASTQKSSSGMIWMILGLVAVVGGVLAFAMSGDDDEDKVAGPTQEEINRKKAAQKAKERDQREADRLARIKREQADAKREEAEVAREKAFAENESEITKKFVGAWQYKQGTDTYRRVLSSNGKSDFFKNGKRVNSESNYTWMLDGDKAIVFKSSGERAGEIALLDNSTANIFDKYDADKLEIGAKWDLPTEEPKMANNDKKVEPKSPKVEPMKKDAQPTDGKDTIAIIDAEEDTPKITMNLSNLDEPQFDVKNFIKKQNEIFKKKIDEALDSKTQRIGPITRKLEREMTESIINWNKGDDGRSTLKTVKLWLAACESKSEILPVPSTLSDKAKEVIRKDLNANAFIIDDLHKRPLIDIEDLRKEYQYEYLKKRAELRPKNDQGAMAMLELTARNNTRSNKAFINIVWRGKEDKDK